VFDPAKLKAEMQIATAIIESHAGHPVVGAILRLLDLRYEELKEKLVVAGGDAKTCGQAIEVRHLIDGFLKITPKS
jgi:hypothetical protein